MCSIVVAEAPAAVAAAVAAAAMSSAAAAADLGIDLVLNSAKKIRRVPVAVI